MADEFFPVGIQPNIIDNQGKLPLPGAVYDRWAINADNNQKRSVTPKRLILGQNKNVTRDAAQDYESSIVSVRLRSGGTYVTTTYIKDQGTDRRINFFTTTPSGSENWSGVLPLPDGYTDTVDPYMSVNQHDAGINRLTMYVVGLAIGTNRRAIVGWASGNGGRNWSPPVIIDESVNVFGSLLDKPHIIVSELPDTLGHIYVSYRQESGALVMRKSDDGGVTWSDLEEEPGIGIISNVNAPLINGIQMAVSPFNNIVYAFWTDFGDDTGRIKWANSLDQGVTWSDAAIFSNAQNLVRGHVRGGIRAPSFPIIRYNWVNPRISVVWHECSQEPEGDFEELDCLGDTDVYYAALTSSGSGDKVRLNDDTGNTDQFLPALDFSLSGNIMTTFYDRRNGGSGYRLFRAWTNINGLELLPNLDVSGETFITSNDWPRPNFIGDYHEIWSTTINGQIRFIPSWIGVNNSGGGGGGGPSAPAETGDSDVFLTPL